MIFMDFYEKHKALFHELLDAMCGSKDGVEVMEWFALRSEDEIVILAYFAHELPSVSRLLSMTLVQQVFARSMDIEKMQDVAKL